MQIETETVKYFACKMLHIMPSLFFWLLDFQIVINQKIK